MFSQASVCSTLGGGVTLNASWDRSHGQEGGCNMQGLFARVGSGDPVRVLCLFHNNYTGYCCIHLLCIATYNLSLPRLSANYYGLPTTVQLRAAHKNRCSRVGISRSTALRYCTVPALNGIITGPFSPPFAGRSLGGI